LNQKNWGDFDLFIYYLEPDYTDYEVETEKPEYEIGPMECVVKPNFDLNKFPVPASIRGMALARYDLVYSSF